MKATVTKATFNRTWNGVNGDVHYFDVTFDNGDYGSYGTKERNQTAFVVGQQAEYERVEDGEYNGQPKYKIKVPYDGNKSGGGGKGRPAGDPKSFAASYAKDIVKALIEAGHVKATGDITPLIQHYFETFHKLLQ